jgi:hypothetical protein
MSNVNGALDASAAEVRQEFKFADITAHKVETAIKQFYIISEL